MSGSEAIGHLAKRREIRFRGGRVERTPLIVPSFSSYAVPPVTIGNVLNSTQSSIATGALISAFDYAAGAYNGVDLTFARLLFVDSGGYELLRARAFGHASTWTEAQYTDAMNAVVAALGTSGTTIVATSYDAPGSNGTLAEQVFRAHSLLPSKEAVVREILLKPERDAEHLDIDVVSGHVAALAEFDIIGVTEKELGGSLYDRLVAVGRLRMALTSRGIAQPIHVFGCMDPVITPLYFILGADIFDGLAWLRYRFVDGLAATIAGGSLRDDGGLRERRPDAEAWSRNLRCLMRMEEDMRRFAKNGSLGEFKEGQDLLGKNINVVLEELGG